MPVPFGFSIGDFIAGIDLVVTSINAIEDGSGSAAEYRAVITTLSGVKSALMDLNKLKIEDAAERHALEILARQCGETMFAFLTKISKYNSSLRYPSSRKWKDAIRKVQWALYSSDDVRRFQTQLQSDLLTLQIMLNRIHISSTARDATEIHIALTHVKKNLDRVNMVQLLILHALSKCWGEFRGLFMMMFLSNMRLIEFILTGLQLSAQIQEERPTFLNDPHGRIIPFLRSWIHGWDDFEDMLLVQFKRVPGSQKISAGEYALDDTLCAKEITRSMPVEAVFLPGRKISMSMRFSLEKTNSSICLKCECPITTTAKIEVTCPSCGLVCSWQSASNDHNGADSGVGDTQQGDYQHSHTDRKVPNETISDFSRVRIVEMFVNKFLWNSALI
jgi:hypothetical protein